MANVEAASSVLSLDEGEGIVNDDEYERAVCWIEKINKIPAIGSSSDRETRRNVFGQGGFMSPMRRIAEAVYRVPEVQDITI